MRAWIRRRWWRYVRGWESEICRECGRPVAVIWTAPDYLWRLYSATLGGVVCVRCFDEVCCEDWDVVLRWVPEPLGELDEHRARALAGGTEEHDEPWRSDDGPVITIVSETDQRFDVLALIHSLLDRLDSAVVSPRNET